MKRFKELLGKFFSPLLVFIGLISILVFFLIYYIVYSPFERIKFRRSRVAQRGEKYSFLITKSNRFRVGELLLSLGRDAEFAESDVFEYILSGELAVILFDLSICEIEQDESEVLIFPTELDSEDPRPDYGYINVSKELSDIAQKHGCRVILCTSDESNPDSEGYALLSQLAPIVCIDELAEYIGNCDFPADSEKKNGTNE